MDNQFTNTAYENFLNQHQLMGSRDVNTGAVFLPPRPVNPETFATGMEWVALSGRATLMAFTVVYIMPTAMLEAGYDRKNPYCVGIVKTEEGACISALIKGVDVFKPETIKIGTALKVVFDDRGEGEAKKTFLAFEPV